MRIRESSVKRALKAGFMSLPKPENNFELLVPDDDDADAADASAMLSVEDAADRDAAIKRRQEEEEKKALARRSQSVQQGLPRPANVDVSALLKNLSMDDDTTEVDRLINNELVELLQHDAIAHPLPGTMRSGASQSTYDMPDDDALAAAKAIINEELANMVGFPSATPAQLKDGLLKISKTEAVPEDLSWATIRSLLAYDAATKSWVEPATLTLEERVAGYTSLLEDNRYSDDQGGGESGQG